MVERGITMSFMPLEGEPGSYVLAIFTETITNSVFTRIDQLYGSLVEFDAAWIHSIPDDQLAALAGEVAAQLLGSRQDPDVDRTFRESIARQVESARNLMNQE